MKIGIEGQRLFRQNKHGMDFVALELVRKLQILDQENEYFVFIKPGPDHCLQSSDNVHIIEMNGGPYPVWEQFALPGQAKKYGCELLHCTSNTAPVYSSIPIVVTIHDIFYLENISLFYKGFSPYQKFGNMYRRFVVPAVVNKSKQIITVSNSEKKRILHFFKLDDSRVSVVYNGVSERFKPITDTMELSGIRTKYHLPEKYIFFLGNTDPKKNTKGVLVAFSKYVRETANYIPLVIVDFPEESLNEILQEIHEPDIRPYIHRLDYIRNSDLPGIYSMASLFLYPSFRESFGIPILEAMSCATPVITSNVFAMPEIAGEAGILIDPNNPYDLARGINRVMTEPGLQETLIARGFEQVKKFSWVRMASEVRDIYQRVLNEKSV